MPEIPRRLPLPATLPERTFIITTATSDRTNEQGLFSHPYTYPQQEQGDQPADRRISRENLFSEPIDPAVNVPAARSGQPPRNPFDRISPNTAD